ncbi:MAG: pilus assembly protein PilM [Elusimicrobia bacterium]|nr:pilus assembly protein PilM [Elusimicrobiota bacterium]
MPGFDDIIEQLAFGKEKRKPGPSLGLYLSPDTIYLAESHIDRAGKFIVDHLVRIPIPAAVKGANAAATMNTDFLSDSQKVAGLIKQSMAQTRWNVKNVRVTLSHHLGMLRYFTMPMLDRRFLRTAVPLESKKYIPIPFDVLAHDFQTMALPPDAAGKNRLGVLIAVTQNKNVPNIVGLLGSLDLQLDGLEVAPCSVLRLWQAVNPPKEAGAFAHVHMDGGNVRVMVSEHGVPIFFREVFLSSDPTLSDLRKIDLAGCLAYIRKQLGIANVTHVRVSGNIPNIAELAAAFSAEAGVEARIQDTPSLLSIKSGEWGGYAALGASAHALVPTPLSLDLAAMDRIGDDERRVARDIMIGGTVAAALLAAAGLTKSATYAYRAQELAKYPLDPSTKAVIGTMAPAQIDALLTEMKKQATDLKVIVPSNRPKLTELLREIIQLMPDKVWLTRISVVSPLVEGEHAGFKMLLEGRAQSDSIADEQALAFKFKDDLLRSPTIGRYFNIQISLERGRGAETIQTAGMDPELLRQKLEDRTKFTMNVDAKR